MIQRYNGVDVASWIVVEDDETDQSALVNNNIAYMEMAQNGATIMQPQQEEEDD